MSTYNFKVRAPFSVTLGAPHSNDSRAKVYGPDDGVVALTDEQIEGHMHKLEPADDAAAAKLSSMMGRLHVHVANQF